MKAHIIKASKTQDLNRAAYSKVFETCHVELDGAADDPDVSDLFDFLINLGVGENNYIGDLEEFGKRFVDSKQRQMRFATFGVLNKIGVAYPWMKIAILKRAYKKPAKSN